MRKGKQEINAFGVIIPIMIDSSVWIYPIFVAAKQVSNKSVSSSSNPCSLSPVEFKHSAVHSLTFMLQHDDVAPSVSLLHFSSRQSIFAFPLTALDVHIMGSFWQEGEGGCEENEKYNCIHKSLSLL